jgi:uncharacterized protein (DUF849 family)
VNQEVIVTCAVTGAGDTVDRSPHVPVTPKEIAESALEAARAGAAIVHIHVRDPETGGISHSTDHFREVVERIRGSDTDVVINITAGGGGDFIINDDDPTVGGPGTDIMTPAERHDPVGELLPEICSLDCGSYNYADFVYLSPAHWVREHAKLIQDAGVRPELECFDLGHIRLAKHLIDEGLVDEPFWFQLCVGIPWAAEANPEALLAMRNQLPIGAQWTALGLGRWQMPMAAQAVLLGGNVRVGLEDNLYLDKGELATNAQLVERAVEIIERLGAGIATPQAARRVLDLRTPA